MYILHLALKKGHYPLSRHLYVNVMMSNITFFMIFAVFDEWLLTQWIN